MQTSVRNTMPTEPELKGKPKLIMHIGLPKTGSTFLQCTFCANSNVTDPILLQDNLVFLGTCPYRTCGMKNRPEQFLKHGRISFVHSGKTKDKKINPYAVISHPKDQMSQESPQESRRLLANSFVATMDELHQTGRNVLIVFEGLAMLEDVQIRALANYLTPLYDVQILVAYRPLYQWLPSKYNSVNKPGRSKSDRVWPGEIWNGKREGKPILPFDIDNRGSFTELVELIQEQNQHPTETCYKNWRLHFENVTVIPMHDLAEPPVREHRVDPVLYHILCHLVPDSKATCRAILDGVVGDAVASNPTVPLHYDILAVAAHAAGWLGGDGDEERWYQRRPKLRSALKAYHQQVLQRKPDEVNITCLPNVTLKRLERLSLELERQFFRDTYTDELALRHHDGFARTVALNKTYCSLDVNRTMRDPVWMEYFDMLKNGLPVPGADDDVDEEGEDQDSSRV